MKRIIFTDRSNDCAKKLLHDIRKSKPLSTDEEYQLWLQMRQGDKSAKNKLIFSNLRYVVTVAKRYQASGAGLDDLINSGALGLTLAANKFDASRGVRLLSFAVKYIESEIRKSAYDHLKYHTMTGSIDDSYYADDDHHTDTVADHIPATTETRSDWQPRYNDTLSNIKSGLDRHYYQGAGEMLDEYLSMTEKGYTTADFARKHHLTKRQMDRFLDIVRKESNHLLN
jgi:RNA polymerase sigma factor (sigma-70 family)